MSEPRIRGAAAALGEDDLTEAALKQHIFPLFSRVRQRQDIYLANHSLGRPLDALAEDVQTCTTLWFEKMNRAWDDWLTEMSAYRSRIAALAHVERPDAIIPKASAGQGLRAVLNTYDRKINLVATRGEFDSIDFILKNYQARGRVAIRFVEPRSDALFDSADIVRAITNETDLVVLSQVFYASGQVLPNLQDIITHAHHCGARVLLDTYHALGVFPVHLQALDVDFAVGGSYKYLRGGPGACWLYVHPRLLDTGINTLDTGWFAKKDMFAFARSDTVEFAPGGDAFLESTLAVLPFYQARSGQILLLVLGVERMRRYSLKQQAVLRHLLGERGIKSMGAHPLHGAFVVVRHDEAEMLSDKLREQGVTVDARSNCLRLCPDILTTADELSETVERLATLMR